MPPKTRTRVGAGALARARKPSGRLNKDDFKNAQKSLKLYPKKVTALQLAKVYHPSEKTLTKKHVADAKKKLKNATPGSLAAYASQVQAYKDLRKGHVKRQSKGPVGTKLRKRSILK